MNKKFYLILTGAAILVVIVLLSRFLVQKSPSLFKAKAPSQLVKLFDEAQVLEAKGSYLEAKGAYKEITEKSQNAELTRKAENALMDLGIKMLFSPVETEDSLIYTVKKGDTLIKIARQFNTTVELIMRSNNLASDLIMPGKKFKISTAKYSVVVDCSQNILTLKSGENVLKTYTVSTGLNNTTPVGIFKIVTKLKDPVWYKMGAVIPSGSPDNILGSRWLAISKAGYGIHGTTQPETIGQSVTAGCVRMLESDVQELYDILPVGAEVTIIE